MWPTTHKANAMTSAKAAVLPRQGSGSGDNEGGNSTPTVIAVPQAGTFFGNWSARDKKIFLLVTGGIVVGTTGFLIARHLIKKSKGARVQQQIVFEGSPASFVQDLINAFEGAGTDEDSIYAVFARMPSQQFYLNVVKAYKDHPNGGNLGDDLGEELDTEELQVVKNILASKPARDGDKPSYGLLPFWSQRLQTAYEGAGTDEDAIYKVLWEVPDQNGLLLLNQNFSKQNGGYSLFTMLDDELSGDELETAKTIIASKK